MTTAYHSQYWAHALTLRGATGTIETLSRSIAGARVELTRTELNGHAKFEPERPRFQYTGPHARQGWYHFDWTEAEKNGDTFYRQDHPLAARVIQDAIDGQRDELIKRIEGQLHQTHAVKTIFLFRWRLA